MAADFDYIVVGSGPGGGTLATELAMRGFETLLIEAGPDYFQANQSTPAFQAKASEDPAISFDFDVKHSDNNISYFYPRAGVLGGCAVHNAMIASYPNSRDFLLMQNVTGDSKWSESYMHNYFKQMEDNQYTVGLVGDHGYSGWFKTSFINFLVQLKLEPALFNYLAAVLGSMGYDVNGRDVFGLNSDKEATVMLPQAVDRTDYTRTNFPKFIKNVANGFPLTVWTDTFVTKVLFNKNTAIGVEYKKGRYLYKASPLSSNDRRKKAQTGRVFANRDIILSGGAFNTPQILMLSGIGDKDHLAKFNIPVVADVPGVGRSMMDRYEVSIVFKYQKVFKIFEGCKFTPTMDDPCYKEYIERRSGPYTSNGVISGQLKKSRPNLDEPDLFILNLLSDFHGYFRGYSNNLAKRTDSSSRIILKAHTDNANGRVKLLSSNPFDVPDINFQSFSDGDADLNVMVNAIKSERSFLKRITTSHVEIVPGENIQTDAQLRDFVRNNAWGHHACCTAKMGPSSDPLAVVDSKFRVRGVKNLRVVDMSVFPRIPGYFPTVYIHMMAMKAADDIAF
ncbi:hypothetical protein DSO57_1004641 [Entomophthora muscae]|uniref:Uncharacterized protein n=1 Tax=Entomophthora muscae TaxID=34485 RepID=A0ACC2SL96_9FUNG|nr:hypothetical protein DSO57_1004641 [Entomophthora muscae]